MPVYQIFLSLTFSSHEIIKSYSFVVVVRLFLDLCCQQPFNDLDPPYKIFETKNKGTHSCQEEKIYLGTCVLNRYT